MRRLSEIRVQMHQKRTAKKRQRLARAIERSAVPERPLYGRGPRYLSATPSRERVPLRALGRDRIDRDIVVHERPAERLRPVSTRTPTPLRLPSRLAQRSRGPLLGGMWLRVLTRWRAADLDRQLANGTDPMQSDELSLRVGQLGSAGRRTRLSHALREAVALAKGKRAPLITTRLRRAEILENDDLLLALADRLRDGEPLGIQGLAMTARLVTDRTGPLYRSGLSSSLPARALEALIALDRGHRTARTT
jgi:hypothetical protein